MNQKKLVIATRGSKLALWQANWIKEQLEQIDSNIEISLKIVTTKGDKILDVPLAKIGGKGLFVKEIEDTLLSREADLAVHSMKDVPMLIPDGLHLSAICKREDPRDAFISIRYNSFQQLPKGAVVGTSSLRRSCQFLNLRPDLTIKQLRGNVDTRIRKLKEQQYDAVVLAVAGLKRLGLQDMITEILDTSVSLPACGQGAVGIECRADDDFVTQLTSSLNHRETEISLKAERAFLKVLQGGCQVPIAAYSESTNNNFQLTALISSIDGKTILKDTMNFDPSDPEKAGETLAKHLIAKGADKILSEIFADTV